MKTSLRIISVILLLCTLAACFASCNIPGLGGSTTTTQEGNNPPEFVDYASQVKLDVTSPRAKQVVTLRLHVDGDTTHFDLKEEIGGSKILKARYLAIDTPESTGAIEKWGKKASNFTKEKLTNAYSILIESDTSTWNPDSTGSRYMVWVWYKATESSEYRNLNLEILQEGLAKAKGTDNTYGETCFSAFLQARALKLHLHGTEKDPDFYVGMPIPVTLKHLATNPEKYDRAKVSFEGVITKNFNNTIYVQDVSEEDGITYGFTVYYGYNFTALDLLKVGNRLKVVGVVSYYEAGGTYQLSDIKYYPFDRNNPECIKVISTDNTVDFNLITPEEFYSRKEITILGEDDEEIIKEVAFAELALNTAVQMNGLYVTDVWTTTNEDSSSYGAMTLTCTANGKTITVRTEPLKDANGNLITEEYFRGKTIDVKGLVAYYNGNYQIKLVSPKDVVVN